MADREDLLRRCMTALSRPGVNGFLGTAEIIEDLTLLGALDGKLVWGSMNRIGLQGASFEMDDRFGAYDADGIEVSHLDGGKMLTRINYADPASAATLEASAKAIDSLSERGLNAMIEPFISQWEGGRIINDLSEEAVIRSICIAQALGRSSAHTWLKLPCVSDPASMRRVMASTSLPSLILGGEVSTDPEALIRTLTTTFHMPYRLGAAGTAAIAFITRFHGDFVLLRTARALRGVGGRWGMLAPVVRWIGSILPLMILAIQHAERVALSMDSRAFAAHRRPRRSGRRRARARPR